MDHYVRGRTWIAATFGNELVRERNDGQDGNFEYTKEEIAAWEKDPESYVKYRKAIEIGMQGGFAMTHRGTKEHEGAWSQFNQEMRTRLEKKPHIAEHLVSVMPPKICIGDQDFWPRYKNVIALSFLPQPLQLVDSLGQNLTDV